MALLEKKTLYTSIFFQFIILIWQKPSIVLKKNLELKQMKIMHNSTFSLLPM